MTTGADDGVAAQAAPHEEPPTRTGDPARTRPAALPRSSETPRARVRLSALEAQAVISRALDLQLREERRDVDALSLEDLTDIAEQVGVDAATVSRALADVRLASAQRFEPSRTERLLGPRQVAGATILPTDPETAQQAVADWMTGDEAMRVTGTRGDTERWAKDKRLLVELRRGLAAGRADGTLRNLPSVAVRTTSDPAGTMVSVAADTSSIRRTTLAILAVSAVGGVGVGVGNAAVIPDTAAIASDVGQFAVSFGVVAAAGTTTAIAVARSWTEKVRRAVDQALEGISMRATRPDLVVPPPDPVGWRATVLRWLGGS